MRRIAALILCTLPIAAHAADNPSFNVVNRTRSEIMELYATPAGMTTWGQDRLVDDTVPPNENRPVRLPADGNCVYDIKAVFASGQSDERRAVNTCAVDHVFFPAAAGTGTGANTSPAAPPRTARGTSTDDPTFRLTNRGRSRINEVYVSPAGEGNWGDDRLGDETLAPGRQTVIRLPRGQCVYDLRTVFANGEATEKRRLNLCATTDLRVP